MKFLNVYSGEYYTFEKETTFFKKKKKKKKKKLFKTRGNVAAVIL